MKIASYYLKNGDGIRCQLCPHNCFIREYETGKCRVRRNIGNELFAENYGKISSLHFDPVEKKPLYHYYPASTILSIGTVGCNFDCDFCQNCEISQSGIDKFGLFRDYSPEEIVSLALQNKQNIGIAYTYNEPFIWYEFVLDVSKKSKAKGLKNVFVTNGYINPEPLEKLLPFADAFNIDLKAFTEGFYKKHTSALLKPVLKTLKIIRKSTCHMEITNLVIPSLNDDTADFTKMVKWISDELGKNTVLHLSRYHPMNRMTIPPTEEQTLLKLFDIAVKYLNFVYLGNIYSSKGNNTNCPECGKDVIRRNGYNTEITALDSSGNCNYCKTNIVMMNN